MSFRRLARVSSVLVLVTATFLAAAPLGHAQGLKDVPDPDYGPLAERERVYDLRHADIALRLDLEAESIEGTVTHSLVPYADDVRELPFDAERLTIRSARVNGAPAEFRTEETRVVVLAPPGLRAGQPVEVALDYEGQPTTGLYWVRPEPGYPDKPYEAWTQGEDEDNHFWVPIHDHPNDRLSWDTRLTVRDGLTAVSNGVLVGVEDHGDGWKTFHHRMELENVAYLIAFAVGPWERYADAWHGKPVEYFVAKGVGEETARRSFGVTPAVLDFFSEYTGVEYPWPKYAQVAVAEFVVGGMENVSCTLQTDRTLHDATSELERNSTSLVAHEAAHQWFGDLVTCRTWNDLWLNEGFASYFDALFAEHEDGVDDFRLAMRGEQRGFLRADPEDAPRPIVQDFYSRGAGGRNNHVYTKGSSVLHMLRFVLGDAAFRKAVHLYLERHRLGLATTEDFQIAVADATGRNLEWFFEEWVRLAGHPKFDVTFKYDDANRQGTMVVRQVQKTGGLVPVFRTPVDVEFVVGGESDVRRVFIDGAENTFSFALAGRPSRTRFDKGGWILKELTEHKPLEEWIEIATRDDDVIGRIDAVAALRDSEDPRATDALLTVLASHDHHDVREDAADALGAKRTPPARDGLIAALDDSDARVRAAAAGALGAFENDAAVAARLARVLREDTAYGPRAGAARSLGRVRGEEAFSVCAEALAIPSEDDAIARAALDSMVRLDATRAARSVLDAAAYGEPIALRSDALRLLGTLGDSLTDAERSAAVQCAQDALGDHWSRTRRQAMSTLEALRAREALDRLDAVARDHRDPRTRASAKASAERIRGGETPRDARGGRGGRGRGRDAPAAAEPAATTTENPEIEALRKEVEALKARLDALAPQPAQG